MPTPSPDAPPALLARELGFAHGARPVLDGVSLRLAPGARLAVLGRSGAGKTTLLRLLAGVIAPAAGTIELGGRPASAPGRVLVAPERRGVGLVFQGLALWPHLSVERTLAFAAAGTRAERRATARRLAERVGLGARLNALPDQLSGGERQRLALTRALARDPALLLLDEPFAHQDPPLREELIGLLLELVRERGTALVVVTHQAEDTLELARDALVLHGGRCVEEGPLARLLAAPAHTETARLLGRGAVLAATREGEGARTALGVLPLAGAGSSLNRVWLAAEQVTASPASDGPAIVIGCAQRQGRAWVRLRLPDGDEVRAVAEDELPPGARVALRVEGAARALAGE